MTGAAAAASAAGLRLLARHDLGGHGDGMQLMRAGDVLYVGHFGTSGMGTSILDVADPAKPVLVAQWPSPARTHTHKVQVAGGLLLVNHEKFPYRGAAAGSFSAGLAVYQLSDPLRPEQIAFWPSGGRGVHRVVWAGGRYAHMSATPDHFRDRIWVVLDLADPARPAEAARWWWPGQREDEQPSWPAGQRYAAHHALLDGNRAYLGYDDAGMVVLDVSDMTQPRQAGQLRWPGGFDPHLPAAARPGAGGGHRRASARRPARAAAHDPGHRRLCWPAAGAGLCPPPDLRYDELPLRFGAHNLHENQAGSYRSERLVFATYFSAGVRVYDLADPEHPAEVAHWVPEPPAGQPAAQINDLFVDSSGLIWATDRVSGGLYVLEPEPALAALMAAARA